MDWAQTFNLAYFIAFAFSPKVLAVQHCTADQPCWPSSDIWSAFNSSVDGHLVAPRPPGWACHDPNYDEVACNTFQTNWNSSFWRANQTGAMQNPIWDSLECDVGTPRDVPCDQGFVPHYSVNAQNDDHVSKAVKFADKYNLRLVVKNTGHDYLGRSSAEGSFGIWTHNLKGINFTDSFVTSGCSQSDSIQPAVTVRAAEQWLDVYKAADEHNVTVVGGAVRSVGAAGGWVQGGGHSAVGGLFGMGVDNALQFTVVKPNGKIVKANKCQNKDLFWALRGGGGGTWGVVLDVTYKTHPPVPFNVVGMIANTVDTGKLTELSEVFFQALPGITDEGLRGYGAWQPPTSIMVLWIHPNGSSLQSTNNTLHPIYDWASANNGTMIQTIGSTHPTFYSMFDAWIKDTGIGNPSWFGTRLVSREAFSKNSKELAKYIWDTDSRLVSSFNIIGGGAISKVDPDSTGLNPQWRKDAIVSWTIGGVWSADTSPEKVEQIKANTTRLIQNFGNIAGLDHAAYFNEADPLEPQWKKSFFGSHYNRLSKIKRKIDPKGLFTCNRCVGSDQ